MSLQNLIENESTSISLAVSSQISLSAEDSLSDLSRCNLINNNEGNRDENRSNQEPKSSVRTSAKTSGKMSGRDSKNLDMTGNLSKYFRIETCRYNQIIYLNASILLKRFKHDAAKVSSRLPVENVPTATSTIQEVSESITEEAENIPLSANVEKEKKPTNVHKGTFKVRYKNLKEKKLTYELALSTLKYESIFEKILEECSFFIQYPDYKEEDQLVLIIFNDYIKRKFQRRSIEDEEAETSNAMADELENTIYNMRTRLNAAVMRTRVKYGVRSLNQLLPDQYRIGEEYADNMQVYMWYNANLVSNEELLKALSERAFKRVSAAKLLEPKEFFQDRHCADLYVFHHDDREFLDESDMVLKQKAGVIQDKSTSLAIHCFIANIVQGEEIAIINPTTLLTAVHVEGLLKNKFGSVIPLAAIRVFRPPKDDDDPKLLQKMGSTAIKIHTEDISTLDSNNEKYRNIKHVLFQARCTRSAVVSPIDFLDTEQDDISLLKDYALRATLDGNKPPKISDSIVRNSMILRQCFRFGTVRSVTYITHSIYEEENELLVNKTVDLINKALMKDTLEPNGKYEIFNNIPPNLPMLIDDLTENGILMEKNIRYPPSSETNGFFIALFAKENRYHVGEEAELVNQDDKPKKKKKKAAANQPE